MDRRISVSIYKQNKQASAAPLVLVPNLLVTLYRCAAATQLSRWLVLGLDVYVFLLKSMGNISFPCHMPPSHVSRLPHASHIFS